MRIPRIPATLPYLRAVFVFYHADISFDVFSRLTPDSERLAFVGRAVSPIRTFGNCDSYIFFPRRRRRRRRRRGLFFAFESPFFFAFFLSA
jgi:hypothetical protein